MTQSRLNEKRHGKKIRGRVEETIYVHTKIGSRLGRSRTSPVWRPTLVMRGRTRAHRSKGSIRAKSGLSKTKASDKRAFMDVLAPSKGSSERKPGFSKAAVSNDLESRSARSASTSSSRSKSDLAGCKAKTQGEVKQRNSAKQ